MSPTSSSGERYHLVATYSVYSPPGPAESGGGGRMKGGRGEEEVQGKERGGEKERKEGR